MPTTEQLLAGMSRIANAGGVVAVLWHIYFATIIVALLLGVRP